MPGILSFCNDALECLSLHHDQGANVFLRHLAYGIVYGVSRAYRKNLVAFFTEQLPDRCHRRLPCGRLAVMRVDPIAAVTLNGSSKTYHSSRTTVRPPGKDRG